MTETAVEVRDLVKRYPKQKVNAVDGLSFDVVRGEVFGLLGPNGAGKTTTIGVLTTRVRPTSGAVRVAGVDVLRDPVGARSRLAVVPQQVNLDRSLTPRQNLIFHAAYHGVPSALRRARAAEMLEQFGLADSADIKVDWYSGGMAQRLMIARALMHEPHVLILDEPTTGLDPQSRLFLWDKMLELRERGTTLMLTTHDMVEADRLCDRIAIIDHGRVIALDTPRGLRRLLPAEHGLQLTVEGPADPVSVFAGLAERIETAADGDGRWTGRLYGNGNQPQLAVEVTEAIRRWDGELVDLRRIEGSLEDVFVHLTG